MKSFLDVASRLTCAVGVVVLAFLVLPLAAQEGEPSAEEAAMMAAMEKAMTPGPEHARLAKQVGTYKATITMWMEPGAPPMVTEGKAERALTLGGRVLVETFSSEFMGMPFEGIGRTGFDNVTGKYWSTWSDNMSTGLSIMEGTADEASGKTTFVGESSNPMAGKRTPVRIEMSHEDGHEVNVFYEPGPDGQMAKTMEIVYVRE